MPVPVLMRRARLRLGLSQQELAQRTELSQPSISNYERGISVPQADQWEVISKVLEIPFAPLIQATASPKASDGSAEQLESRRRLLNTLSELPLEVEVLDQPLDGGGGTSVLRSAWERIFILFGLMPSGPDTEPCPARQRSPLVRTVLYVCRVLVHRVRKISSIQSCGMPDWCSMNSPRWESFPLSEGLAT